MFLGVLKKAVHKVRHAIFDQFYPLPFVKLRHTSRDPRKYVTHLGSPDFLEGLVQKPGQKPLVQILSQLFVGIFVRWFLSEGLFSFVW